MLKVQLENFRSYESVEFTFPTGLTLIDGLNGAGKSNLLDGWFWCRYGWLPKWEGPKGGRADGVIRRGSTKCKVTVTEKFGQDEIKIERQRPHKLTVWKNGTKVSASQEELEKLINMSPERFLVCSYLAQNRRKSFFSMNDTERMDLLSVVAGLEELDRALEKAKTLKSGTQAEVNMAEGKVALASKWMEDGPAKIQAAQLFAGQARIKVSEIQTQFNSVIGMAEIHRMDSESARDNLLASALERAESKLKVLCPKLEDAMARYHLIERQMKETPRPDQSLFLRVAEAKDRLAQHESLMREQERTNAHNAKILEKIRYELDEMDRAKEGRCSSCSQPLPTWELQQVADKHLKKAQEFEGQIRPEITIDQNSLPLIKAELEDAEAALSKKKAELDVLPQQLVIQKNAAMAEYSQFKSEVELVESARKSEVAEAEKAYQDCIRAIENHIQQAKNELVSIERSLTQADAEVKRYTDELEKQASELRELKSQLDALEARLNEALDLIELFGPKGFRSICFDGLIQRISDRAGQLISTLSDGLYSTYLQQTGTDSKGNQKLVLQPVIVRGGEIVFSDDLSGGFEDRVALAYDLAVSEAAGDGLPLLLDETMKGLDPQGKVEAMALLEEVSKGRPVLVIEHTSEMKAMFHQVIKISLENDRSLLVEGV